MLRSFYHKNQNGYLLLEVMVTALVFSSALIALFALQINAYSASQSATYRNTATNYANDFFDKMRANKDGVINGTYISVSGKNNKCRSVNFNTINTPVSCSSTQMAEDDLFELETLVSSTLPQGEVVLCMDSTMAQGTPEEPNCSNTGNKYVVKIFWKDSRSKLIGTNSEFSQVIVGAQL